MVSRLFFFVIFGFDFFFWVLEEIEFVYIYSFNSKKFFLFFV